MKLSTLAILLGVLYSIPQVYGLVNPPGFIKAARKFPRSEPVGFFLMIVGTAWFLHNLNQETISDFAAYKTYMMVGFGAIGLGACVFVRDFLAVRGLALVMLLAAWYTLNITRVAESPWRLVLVVWAYGWVVASMWFTISPWRCRDILNWKTATEGRVRTGGALRLAFGIFVVILGFTAFKN